MRSSALTKAGFTLLLAFASACSSAVGSAPQDDAGARDGELGTTPARCAFDAPENPTRPVLAVAAGPTLHLVRADGTTFAAHTFGVGRQVAPESIVVRDIVGRGEYVAASSWVHDSRWGEVVLLHAPTGRVIWRLSRDFAQGPSGGALHAYRALQLNAEGTLAFGVANDSDDGLIVRADGSTTPLPRTIPLSEVTPTGVVLVQDLAGAISWLEITSGARTPLALRRPQDFTAPRWSAGRAIYWGTRDGATVLVSASPSDAQVVAPPAEAGTAPLFVRHVDREGRAVFGARFTDATRRALWRADFARGEVTPLRLDLPSGMRLFSANASEFAPQFGDDGAMLLGLRDDYFGWLFASSDFGRNWTRIGRPVRDTLAFVAEARGGTYLFAGTQNPPRDSFQRPVETWLPPPSGSDEPVADDVTQFARPGDGALGLVPRATGLRPTLSAEGACAVFGEGVANGTVRFGVLDVLRARTIDLDVPQDAPRPNTSLAATAAWIE